MLGAIVTVINVSVFDKSLSKYYLIEMLVPRVVALAMHIVFVII
jgi:hypothetical protein